MKNHLKPVLKVRYVLDQNRISPEFGETTTPGFTILDFNLAYRLGKKNEFSIWN